MLYLQKVIIMTIQDLYQLYSGHPVVCTDTRKITPGCIFFALKGESFDGNAFAQTALERGASFAVIDNAAFKENEQYIVVGNVLQTLQELARYHREQLSIPVIGITGTNGKTTTKELLRSVLSQKFNTYATSGNLNNHIGVPLTLLAIREDIELAIIEMGANHLKEIELLCSIARPTHGLITNVGKAHLEGFGSFEGVKKAKGELYDFLKETGGTVFINLDNENLVKMYGEDPGTPNVIGYGSVEGSYAEGRIVENNPFLTVDWISGEGVQRVKTNLTGTYNLENITAAVAVGLHFRLNAEEINKGLNLYIPGNNRSQIIQTGHNTLICDFYNANPSSMAVALDNLAAISSDKKAMILGDMFELGSDAAQEHRAVMEKAMATEAVERIFVGEEFYRLQDTRGARFYRTTEDAFEGIKRLPVRDAVILVKGSRGMRLENLTGLL